jgi:hypothetical protein
MLGNVDDEDYEPRTFSGRLVTRYVVSLGYWQIIVDDGQNGWLVERDSVETIGELQNSKCATTGQ